MAEARTAEASAAGAGGGGRGARGADARAPAGGAAKAKACSPNRPMPGTLRWIMNGITLMPAPTIEQTPVAVRPARPISRARRGSVVPVTVRAIGGFYLFARKGTPLRRQTQRPQNTLRLF